MKTNMILVIFVRIPFIYISICIIKSDPNWWHATCTELMWRAVVWGSEILLGRINLVGWMWLNWLNLRNDFFKTMDVRFEAWGHIVYPKPMCSVHGNQYSGHLVIWFFLGNQDADFFPLFFLNARMAIFSLFFERKDGDLFMQSF